MTWFRSFVLVLALGGLALGAGINESIRDLGSDDFKKREAATAALSEMGPEAIPDLEAAAKDKDPEVRWRAEKALQAIRARTKDGAAKPRDKAGAETPSSDLVPPQPVPLGEAFERAKERLKGIEEELGRVRPELKDFLRAFGGNDFLGEDFNRILEEMQRRFRDLDRADQPPRLHDFWSFRYKDGKWELIRPGEAARTRVGLRTQPVPPVLRAQLRLKTEPEGIVVEEVAPESIAARAGLERWDLIFTIDGQPVASDSDLERLAAAGDHRIEIVRAGERKDLAVKVEAAAAPEEAPPEEPAAPAPEKAPAAPEEKGELRKY